MKTVIGLMVALVCAASPSSAQDMPAFSWAGGALHNRPQYGMIRHPNTVGGTPTGSEVLTVNAAPGTPVTVAFTSRTAPPKGHPHLTFDGQIPEVMQVDGTTDADGRFRARVRGRGFGDAALLIQIGAGPMGSQHPTQITSFTLVPEARSTAGTFVTKTAGFTSARKIAGLPAARRSRIALSGYLLDGWVEGGNPTRTRARLRIDYAIDLRVTALPASKRTREILAGLPFHFRAFARESMPRFRARLDITHALTEQARLDYEGSHETTLDSTPDERSVAQRYLAPAGIGGNRVRVDLRPFYLNVRRGFFTAAQDSGELQGVFGLKLDDRHTYGATCQVTARAVGAQATGQFTIVTRYLALDLQLTGVSQ